MRTIKVKTLNSISPSGLERFSPARYSIGTDFLDPDVILLRSFNLQGVSIPESVIAVGRAGAGVNNIPIADYSARGIPVFNTPGANANAVKEITLAGLFLASRQIPEAIQFVKGLKGDDETLQKAVEKGKKDFAGHELRGKTLGVLGLGAIGVEVANAAVDLGLNVWGFDPQLTVENAWKLSPQVSRSRSVEELVSRADYITLHVPLTETTRHLIDGRHLGLFRPGAVVLNFSRAAVIAEEALLEALRNQRLGAYVTDFPTQRLLEEPRAILLPHLGASTEEAEENCARVLADQVREYLEQGVIRNSVNFPEVILSPNPNTRLAIAHTNVPNMVGQMTRFLAEVGLNIQELINKSREDLAYTVIDLEAPLPAEIYQKIAEIRGVRLIRWLLAEPA